MMQGPVLRVAIVDDEVSVRRALERLLRSAGMETVTYASGLEMLTALERARPDCVVLDLHMPNISGFEIMELLSDCCPVVVMTGHDSLEARVQANPARAFLRKPIADHELIGAIITATSTT
jgi:FixJ family two-component response regulator